jgi:hypothetical protein
MKAFDARCHACDAVHIIWVPWAHEEDDEINFAHRGGGSCGGYGPHTLVRQLDGVDHHEKWGPPADEAETEAAS